jgi:hypothetical protein
MVSFIIIRDSFDEFSTGQSKHFYRESSTGASPVLL